MSVTGMNVVLIGPSGAGKGTQAERLVTRFGMVHLAPGNLFREHLERGTDLGRLAKRYMDEGELVPEELTEDMIRERLRRVDPAKGVLLDGFPRTEYQAVTLDEMLSEAGRSLDAAVYLYCSEEVIVTDRIPGRLTCKSCQRPYHERHAPPRLDRVCDVCAGELDRRSDDTAQMAKGRLRLFYRQSAPVVFYYLQARKLYAVDGGGDIERVAATLADLVGGIQGPQTRRATREETERIPLRPEAPRWLSREEVAVRGLDIVLLGAPGSGKGTQAEQICSRLGLVHISTGDLFRENLRQETELGKLAKTFMDRGELVPDDVTEAMVNERLSRPDTAIGFVLDGFPRTLPQAEALTEMMTGLGRRISGVLYIRVSDEEIIQRLSGRLICRKCQTPYHRKFKPPATEGVCDVCGGELYQRDDDKPQTVRARLRTFHRQTAPLIDYYRKAGLLTEVDGEGGVEVVTRRALEAAEKLKKWGQAPFS